MTFPFHPACVYENAFLRIEEYIDTELPMHSAVIGAGWMSLTENDRRLLRSARIDVTGPSYKTLMDCDIKLRRSKKGRAYRLKKSKELLRDVAELARACMPCREVDIG